MPFADHYRGKKVLVTGHTGFKGSWLTEWLLALGADVCGLALEPPTEPSLFEILGLRDRMHHLTLDIRDRAGVAAYVAEQEPEVVFHLAAQPLVRRSYRRPLETLDTNVTGTANLLAAVRSADRPCTLVVVTTDKVYENPESGEPFREADPMGGHDLYSASKGMVELLVSSWRRSFHPPGAPVRIATCRAGNAIGGGDWAPDRMVVDAVAALTRGEPIPVRNPLSCRPWQHVLDPLSGYLLLGVRLGADSTGEFRTAFNFGPGPESERSVGELCDAIVDAWGSGSWQHTSEEDPVQEAGHLTLAIDRARRLGWQPTWDFRHTVAATVEWYRRDHETGHDPETMRALTRDQITRFEGFKHRAPSPSR
jgi:CDP-glucose 4,6-dehydratase